MMPTGDSLEERMYYIANNSKGDKGPSSSAFLLVEPRGRSWFVDDVAKTVGEVAAGRQWRYVIYDVFGSVDNIIRIEAPKGGIQYLCELLNIALVRPKGGGQVRLLWVWKHDEAAGGLNWFHQYPSKGLSFIDPCPLELTGSSSGKLSAKYAVEITLQTIYLTLGAIREVRDATRKIGSIYVVQAGNELRSQLIMEVVGDSNEDLLATLRRLHEQVKPGMPDLKTVTSLIGRVEIPP